MAIHRAGAFVPNTTGSVSDADRASRGRSFPKMRLSRGRRIASECDRAAKSRLPPTEAEVTDAKQVLERYQALQRTGRVFEELDGRVIDLYEARMPKS